MIVAQAGAGPFSKADHVCSPLFCSPKCLDSIIYALGYTRRSVYQILHLPSPVMVDETTPLLHDDESLQLPRSAHEAKEGLDNVRMKDWILIAIISCSGFLNVRTLQAQL